MQSPGFDALTKVLAEYYNSGEKHEKYIELEKKCPYLPMGLNKKGNKVYLPADEYTPELFNSELPELYYIYPYSPRGLNSEEKNLGRETYMGMYEHTGRMAPHILRGDSWHQNGIFAARLGLYDEALKYLHIKFDDAPKRFPAFWGPGQDFTPDHNHGGSGMILLQEMLMQCEGDELSLLPTWDKDVDVEFRLFAPNREIIELTHKNGETETRILKN